MTSDRGRSGFLRIPVRGWRRWWRATVRPMWREARPTLLLIAALASLTLGTIGYLQLPGHHYDVLDALYRAIQLFALGGAVEEKVPVALQIARILAPVVTGVAAVQAVLQLWRSQLQLLGLRLLMRNHVVIAGIGDTGSRLATAFNDAGHKVVGLELDPANPHLPSLAERGISVLGGDASDPALLRRARISTARYLFATCGEDGRNVDIAMVAARATDDGRPGVLNAFVHLVDLALWRALKAEAVVAIDQAEFRLELFNVLDAGARMLLDRNPPFTDGQGAPLDDPHICMVGLEGVGEHLLVQMATRSRTERAGHAKLRITLAGPDADTALAEVVERHPELEEICVLDARPGAVESSWFQHGGALLDQDGHCDITRVYVSLKREADALAAALGLHGAPPTREIPVVVAVNDAGGGLALVLRSEGSSFAANVEPFGVLSAALRPDLVLTGTNEVLARAKHEDYLRQELAKPNVKLGDNDSLQPWDRLPESLRDSNRRFADGVGAILTEAGCAVVPAPLIDPLGDLETFTDEELERLARFEHDRWMRDLLRDGWQYTDGPKDPHRKLHPLLRPWEKLEEVEREKDRDAIRLIPQMLAHAGYELYRPALTTRPRVAP